MDICTMRSIVQYIKDHLRADFKIGYYLVFVAFIAACILLNYGTAPEGFVSWGSWIIRTFYVPYSAWCFPVYFLFFAFPYLAMAGITAWFNRDADFWRKRDFWIRAVFILLVLSLDATIGIYRLFHRTFQNNADQYYLTKILAPLNPYILVGIPILVFWWWFDRRRGKPFLYGLTRKGFKPGPYFLLLGLIFPFVLLASSQPQFLSYYPTLKMGVLRTFSLLPEKWMGFLAYEIVYGLYFIWAEVVFRGFLTIGMKESMGRHAVVPMTSLYAFRHFAKPAGETVSSVFGGYILGVVALRTDNIIGGAILHSGIAVMMDVLAFWMSSGG